MASNGAGGILRQEQAIPFESDLLPPSKITAAGFSWGHGGYTQINAGMQATRHFIAPSCVRSASRYRASSTALAQGVLCPCVAYAHDATPARQRWPSFSSCAARA